MTPDNIILTLLALIAIALFVAYHFAMQASYYKKQAKAQLERADRQRHGLYEIAAYVAPQKSGTAHKVFRMAMGMAQ